MRASPGAEKVQSALHPEKLWSLVIGRGFNSRHLHHVMVATSRCHSSFEGARSWGALLSYAVRPGPVETAHSPCAVGARCALDGVGPRWKGGNLSLIHI